MNNKINTDDYISTKNASEILGILPSNTGRLCKRHGIYPKIGTWYLRKDIIKLKLALDNPPPAKIRPITLSHIGQRGKKSKLEPYTTEIIGMYHSGVRVAKIAKQHDVSRAWMYQFIASRIGG